MWTIDRRRLLLSAPLLAGASPSLLQASLMPQHLTANRRGSPERVRFPAGDSHVVANLYRPSGYDPAKRWPAVVIGGSLTAVKEQMGGIYAIELADRGFLALAIDYRNYGESGGAVRQLEDPETKAQDWVAALDWLTRREDVAANQLAGLGICTSGGTVLYAGARDRRLGAIACVASHFAEPAITPSLYGGDAGVAQRRERARRARAVFDASGRNETILAYSNKDQTASHPGPNEYYMDPARGGGVAAWQNAFAVMSWEQWLNFDPVAQARAVTAPTLIVHSDECALPAQARKVYGLLGGPGTLHWAEGPHFEFYDGVEKVRESANVVAEHFRRYLGANAIG